MIHDHNGKNMVQSWVSIMGRQIGIAVDFDGLFSAGRQVEHIHVTALAHRFWRFMRRHLTKKGAKEPNFVLKAYQNVREEKNEIRCVEMGQKRVNDHFNVFLFYKIVKDSLKIRKMKKGFLNNTNKSCCSTPLTIMLIEQYRSQESY